VVDHYSRSTQTPGPRRLDVVTFHGLDDVDPHKAHHTPEITRPRQTREARWPASRKLSPHCPSIMASMIRMLVWGWSSAWTMTLAWLEVGSQLRMARRELGQQAQEEDGVAVESSP